MEEIPEVDSVPEIEVEESIDVDLGEQPVDFDALLLMEEEEPPGYVVASYEKSEIFSMYVVIILAVLIAYPLMRVIIKAGKGAVKWR